MNAQQAENIRILIRHMESNVERPLNMNAVAVCGTPACAMGELPSAFQEFSLSDVDYRLDHNGSPKRIAMISADFFGLGGKEFNPSNLHYRLFGASSCNAWGRSQVTPKEWAAEARKVLTEHGYRMDDGFAAFRAKVLEPVAVEA